MPVHLDDRLFPVDQGCVIRGSYRGRRMRQFVPERRPGSVVQRALHSTSNGWHRIIISVDGVETYRTPATRDREAAKALLIG
jgi:hypothetical protein